MQTARISELRKYDTPRRKPHIFYEAGDWYTRAPHRHGLRHYGASPVTAYRHYKMAAGWRLTRDV